MLAAFATAVVLATSWGGTTYAWSSPVIIGLFAGSVVLLVAWYFSARRAAEPVLPLRLFRNSVFAVAAAIGLAAGFAMFGALSYLPLFLQVVHGVSPTISGVYLLPMVLGLLITSIGSGQLIARTGRYKVFPIVGTALHGGRAVPAVHAGRDHPDLADERVLLHPRVQPRPDPAGAGHRGAEHGQLPRPRRGHLGRDVLPHDRRRRSACRCSAPSSPTSSPASWPAALRGQDAAARGSAPPPSSRTPAALKTLPADLRQAILHAYSLALHPVFLTAVADRAASRSCSPGSCARCRCAPRRASRPRRRRRCAARPAPPTSARPWAAPRPADLGARRSSACCPGCRATDLRRFGYAKLARAAGPRPARRRLLDPHHARQAGRDPGPRAGQAGRA